MNYLTKLFQQKRRRIGYILAFSGPMISKRDSSDKNMNKSNPRTVLKKIVLVSYTLSMIVFSCIVMGFSKDLAIIYCSATLASVCTFFYKKHRTVNWILLSFALMSTYTLFIRVKTFTTIKEIMIPSLAICGLSFIIMWCSCCLKKILRKRQH